VGPATSDEPPTDIRKIYGEVKASRKAAHAKYNGKRLKLTGANTYFRGIARPRFLVEDIQCFWRESRVIAEDEIIIAFVGEDTRVINVQEEERIVFEGKINIDMSYNERAEPEIIEYVDGESTDYHDDDDGIVPGPLTISDCTISNPWTSGRRLGNTKMLPESRRQ
jgi:predicted RNA-binding protein